MQENHSATVLIVDNNHANCQVLETALKRPDLTIMKAATASDALSMVKKYDYALVLMDTQLPGIDGFKIAKEMRNNSNTRHIPIIFLTSNDTDDKLIFQNFESSAVDYLSKPIDTDILKGKVNTFLELHKQRNALETANLELKEANRKIQKQQDSLIEEERLKVLLQMAGATAHEMNQPLMSLLGYIELMEMSTDDPDEIRGYIPRIKDAGKRLSGIVKKIQTLRHHEIKPYDGQECIINFDQKVEILSVEDSDDDFKTIQKNLIPIQNIHLTRSKTLEEAWHRLETDRFDMIFLEHVLPDGTGHEFMLKLFERGSEMPVIIITRHGDEMLASNMIQAGAYDYLPKDKVSFSSLARVVNSTLEKSRLRMEIRKAQNKLAQMSTVDELTRLYNRRYFNEALDREISKARRYGTPLVLGMIDLDHFKSVNDTFGHPAGDRVLSDTGRLLEQCFRDSDLICRYGGEEFAVILPNIKMENAINACERFREIMESHVFKYEGGKFNITVSIGVTTFNKQLTKSIESFIAQADQALYAAKSTGRNKVVIQ